MSQSRFFHGLGRAEREEWRAHPVTREALQLILDELENTAREAVRAAGSDSLTQANVAHGRHVALETILGLLGKER